MSPLPGRGTKTSIDDEALEASLLEEKGADYVARLASELGNPPPEIAEALETAAAGQAAADGEATSQVVVHLDAAIAAAQSEGMSTAELMGMLFYYAHNVAQSAREGVLVSEPLDD